MKSTICLNYALVGLIMILGLQACNDDGGNGSEETSQSSSEDCSALADDQSTTFEDEEDHFISVFDYPSNWETHNYNGISINASVGIAVPGGVLLGYGVIVGQGSSTLPDDPSTDGYERYSRDLEFGGESYPVWVDADQHEWAEGGVHDRFYVEIPTENSEGEPYTLLIIASIEDGGGGTADGPPIKCTAEAEQVLEEIFFSQRPNPDFEFLL